LPQDPQKATADEHDHPNTGAIIHLDNGYLHYAGVLFIRLGND
jgi:hypothetical protein